MPKRTLTKPKPDPLAKVSAPNLRRLVKRLQADERRLTRVCQSHHERYLQTLARVMELEDQLAEALINQVPLDPNDHPHPCGALEGERYALTPQVTQVSEPLPDDGVEWPTPWTFATATEPLPDPAPATEVWHVDAVRCNVTIAPSGRWHRSVEADGEDTRAIITMDNTPAEVQVPTTLPAMPGMTLEAPWARLGVNRWRSWWTWLRHDGTLTCPAAADSPEGRAAVEGEGCMGSRVRLGWRLWPRNPANTIYGRETGCGPTLDDPTTYPLPPATWRQA